jgi:3-oxoacyl-[acyl-carrier protein] reductase
MTSPSYVVVTGGTGGIGSALCRLLPASGLAPIVGYRNNREQAETLARECGGLAVELDLASDASIAQALGQLSEKTRGGGNISGVVLAASPPPDLSPFGKLTPAMLLHQFRINVAGPQMLLAGLIKSHFRKNKSGTVVGILSEAMGGENRPPATGMGAYVIAKNALRGMLSVCAAEYPWLKVRTVSPGFTRTGMLDVFDERYLEQMQAIKPFASAEEVARLVLEEMTP